MPAISESGLLAHYAQLLHLTRGSADDQKNAMLSQLLDQAARARRSVFVFFIFFSCVDRFLHQSTLLPS